MLAHPSGRVIAGAAVSLIADATERTIGEAAAVAAGVADALALELEPATRLSTIAVEASRNVVAHAYPGGERPGPLQLRIEATPERSEPRSLTVSVSDLGEGITLTPTPGDPPGLGLSMISALSDVIAIRSGSSRGTSLDATLSIGDEVGDSVMADVEPEGSSTLSFGDLALLTAVVPRALAAHVRHPRLTFERLAETILLGDAIVRAIHSTVKQEPPDLKIMSRSDDARLRLRIGPTGKGHAEALISAIGRSWRGSRPSLALTTEEGTDGRQGFALLDLAPS